MSKKALVFGHTSGLGFAITETLLEEGYEVIGIARTISSLKSNSLTNVTADLIDEAALEKVVNQIKLEHASFEVLVFAAGTLTAHFIDAVSYSDMEYLYKLNVFAPMFVESRLLELIKENSTYVVNVTSSALLDYYPQFAEYSSSKAAFAKFTKDLQKELKETGARVIDVCPSGFTSNIYKTMKGDKINRDESLQMRASDLAGLIVYILKLPKKVEVTYLYINRK